MLTKNLKNYREVTITQQTATGQDDSARTTLYLAKGDLTRDSISIVSYNEMRDLRIGGVEMVGTVTVIHPAVMAGSWGEAEGLFKRRAAEYLADDGILYEEGPVYFLSGVPYGKGTFEEMIRDWQADHTPEYDSLEIDEPELQDGKWTAAARDDKAEYQLSGDGDGNIVINYVGSR